MKLNKTQLQERRWQAYDLHLRGVSYRQIAEALNVSLGTAFSDVDVIAQELRETRRLAWDRYVQVNFDRLELILTGLMRGGALNGDVKSARAAVAVIHEISDLLGLAAKAKAEVDLLQRVRAEIEREAERRGLSEEDKARAIAEAERIFGSG